MLKQFRWEIMLGFVVIKPSEKFPSAYSSVFQKPCVSHEQLAKWSSEKWLGMIQYNGLLVTYLPKLPVS